jgi:carboxyl-terminal processing protease
MNFSKLRSFLKKHWVLLALQVVIVGLAMGLGYLGHSLINKDQGELSLLREAKEILVKNIIYELPQGNQLEYGMIRGMLAALDDPYTFFVEPAEAEVQSDELTGSFGGIGVRLERDLDAQWRIYPLPDSPAKLAGLQDGDQLLRVGELIVTEENDEVSIIAQLRGPLEEIVDIEILRKGENLTFSIERQVINLPSVSWNLVPDAPSIGLVQVNRIAETTTAEMVTGIDEMIELGATAFILDLRDNGGGLVESGIEISKLFLDSGDIMYRQFKGEDVDIFSADEPGVFSDLPVVIWTNGYTASAAEIIAGALSNNGKAMLIGAPTYGKTTIQYVFTLQDGSSIHVTSGHWWIPGMTFPLIPDVQIEEKPSDMILLENSLEILGGK